MRSLRQSSSQWCRPVCYQFVSEDISQHYIVPSHFQLSPCTLYRVTGRSNACLWSSATFFCPETGGYVPLQSLCFLCSPPLPWRPTFTWQSISSDSDKNHQIALSWRFVILAPFFLQMPCILLYAIPCHALSLPRTCNKLLSTSRHVNWRITLAWCAYSTRLSTLCLKKRAHL